MSKNGIPGRGNLKAFRRFSVEWVLLFRCVFCFASTTPLVAADYYVDNVHGSDTAGDGSEAKPYQTIARAFAGAKESDAVYLTPNDMPYTELVDIPAGGTPEKPFIFDGRGAIINRLTHYEAASWKDEGDGVFSMPLPNNAHVMDGQWRGFDLVFFDSAPGTNTKSQAELASLGYFLFKQQAKVNGGFHPLQNTLFVKLPPGKTPTDIKIEAPGDTTVVHSKKSNVIIRNVTAMFSTRDGFATSNKARGVVFENVHGTLNMDQGISNHGTEVTVKNSRFDHNAGCGVVDVYPECKTTYIGCTIEDDSYRGGVEFHSGTFVMRDCTIRNNPVKALSVQKGATVHLENCTIEGSPMGVVVNEGSLTMKNCTVKTSTDALVLRAGVLKATVFGTTFAGNQRNYVWEILPSTPEFVFDGNTHSPAKIRAFGIDYTPEQWTDFQKATGLDTNSKMQTPHLP